MNLPSIVALMRTHGALRAIVVAGLFTSISAFPCAADRVASVVATAHVTSRTSLTVSTSTLRFQVTDASHPGRATVEFDAGARVSNGSEIVLTVEASDAVQGPGGPAAIKDALTFSGTGEGTVSGGVPMTSPVQAARWHGSGRRRGTLTFEFRASVPGEYVVPLHFALSAP
jgi:hypothetical protein